MQEYEGRLNFATDAWTSPNHRAYVAVTVHLELNGEMVSLVLDVAEVPKVRYCLQSYCWWTDIGSWKSHSGLNLAIAFQQILEDFGIEHKVSLTSNRRP